MYFFLLGMAILYLPFFLLGNGFALIFDFSLDGFSLPYQYAMVIGGLFYTLLGLFYLRKILLEYIPDKIAALVLIIVVLATNFSHHLSIKNLETVNVLFLFVCLIIWNTIQWHKTQQLKNLLAIGACITLMSMVKPSEVMIVLLPIFYGVYSIHTWQIKWKLIVQHKVQFLWMLIVCLLIALPQMSYWCITTGSLFYDSYINPGVGLDFFSPYIFESLFSYKKGWLIYTPVMVLALVGFYNLFKKRKESALAFTAYFVITTYIIFSWTEWWYGAGFSNRPLITTYPILAITMGLFLNQIFKHSIFIKAFVSIFIVLSLLFNQFQWWQLRNGILEPYRTTKEYYWASFFKTSVTDQDKNLLSVYRDFQEDYTFKEEDKYKEIFNKIIDFSEENDSSTYLFTKDNVYFPMLEQPFESFTDKNHLWVKVNLRFKSGNTPDGKLPILICSIQREEGEYGYYARTIQSKLTADWRGYQQYYLTPNLRNKKDRLKIYLWNKDGINCEIDNLVISIFERN
jgi:hypothetical protein